MRVEITQPPVLSPEQLSLLEMHSVVNVTNLLTLQLGLLEEDMRRPGSLALAIQRVVSLAESFKRREKAIEALAAVEMDQRVILELVAAVLAEGAHRDATVDEGLDNLRQLLAVLVERALDLVRRSAHPSDWDWMSLDDVRGGLHRFLLAVEKNSRGRFRIVTNVARQAPRDYLASVVAESVDGDRVYAPCWLPDVLRDLVANARKYSEPGKSIHVGLYDDGRQLRIVVTDQGRGIPEAEVSRVVEYGYRASNVAGKATFGGGFGLTKAWTFTQLTHGRFWIDSVERVGTKIEIVLPRPAKPGEGTA